MPVREVLVEAGQRVQQEFAATPAVHIEVMNTVARLLLDIDEFELAGNSGAIPCVLRTRKI
jgi:hypothetical protein